tara:strand:- start:433 stop:849 length:417 start_codon:yes stop_codon:yes gene_type:complete
MKLKPLLEGYAWERKPGAPLPTLKGVKQIYEQGSGQEAVERYFNVPDIVIFQISYDTKDGTEDNEAIGRILDQRLLDQLIQKAEDSKSGYISVTAGTDDKQYDIDMVIRRDGDIDVRDISHNGGKYDEEDIIAKLSHL